MYESILDRIGRSWKEGCEEGREARSRRWVRMSKDVLEVGWRSGKEDGGRRYMHLEYILLALSKI